MKAPTMPEIRQTIQQARDLTGREDTNEFAVEAPRMLARLVAILDLYVGHEPTLAEEAAYKHRTEVLAEAVALIEAARAADEAAYPNDIAHINRRIGMRESMTALRREYEPAREPSRRPHVRRPAHGKDTDGARQAPAGESTQPAPGTCGRALSTGQPCPDHPTTPRTERAYWVAITEALNAALAAGIPVGINMEGILTDHNAWAVMWNRITERWELGEYEDDDTDLMLGDASPAEADANDWVICCSPNPRCPNGERRARAVERGWTTNGRAGNWLCAEHSPDFFQPGHTYTAGPWAFRCDTVTTHPETGGRTALGWARIKNSGWSTYSHTEEDWADETWAEATGSGGAA